MVTALRILLGSVLAGTFLGPTFFLSLAGGAAAVGAMVIFYQGACGPLSLVGVSVVSALAQHVHVQFEVLRQRVRVPLSLVGVSVVSALAHTLAVFFLVHAFLIPQEAFLTLLPFFFSLALLSGILNGMAANHLARRLLREGLRLK